MYTFLSHTHTHTHTHTHIRPVSRTPLSGYQGEKKRSFARRPPPMGALCVVPVARYMAIASTLALVLEEEEKKAEEEEAAVE